MNLERSDLDVFFGPEFSLPVEAWGVHTHGILDMEWIDFDGIERNMTVLTLPEADVPLRLAHGDPVMVDGVHYRAVDRRNGEPGLARVVLIDA